MKKTMVIILVIGFILMAGLFFLEREKLRSLKTEARAEKERLAELERQNHGLDIRLKMISKMNQELEQKLSALEKERAQLNEKLQVSQRRLKEIQKQVAEASPDDLVWETRRILQEAGVEKIDAGARFSLAAFKKNTGILLEWEEFNLVRVPILEKKAENLERSNLNLQNQVLLWKEADRLWRQKNTLWLEEKMVMNGLIINYEKQISSRKRQRWYFFILGALAGAGGHALMK
ncbi:MAG: hypothetical protein QHH14_11380 [Clostridiales bacterium]|jgi:chromosome segregation ATPase|nr:hypothetical protein [Clostridiales bacterium]